MQTLSPVLSLLLLPCALAQAPTATGNDDQTFAADPRGQWAASATASSSYGTAGYSPARATGAPDVDKHSDNAKAWATAKANDGPQWLELTFEKAVPASELRVRQSFHPGAIVKVELFDAAGNATVVFEGVDATVYPPGEIGWFVCRFAPTTLPVARARLTLDTDRVAGWNEIDAVQLVAAGKPGTVAATAGASASSTRLRHDIVRFDLPAGWTRQDADGELRLLSPDKAATLSLGRSVAFTGSIEDFADAQLEAAQKCAEFRLETALRSGPHKASSGRSAMFAFSCRLPDRRDQFSYCARFCVAAGGRAVTFALRADSAKAYDRSRTAYGEFVNGAQLTTGMRLERGTPPLTRYVVDETNDFLEWLVHSPMTEAQQETIEQELRRYWREGATKEIEGIAEMLVLRTQLAALDEAQRELARQAGLAEALKSWRAEPDSSSARMMLAVYDAANAPIAAGEPPLVRQAVLAFAEYVTFAAGQTVGSTSKLPQATQDELVTKVAAGWSAMTAGQRQMIAGMPVFWAVLRAGWPELAKEQQQRFLAAWQQDPQIAALGRSMAQLDAMANTAATSQQVQQASDLQAQMIQNQIRNDYNYNMMRSDYGGSHSYLYRW